MPETSQKFNMRSHTGCFGRKIGPKIKKCQISWKYDISVKRLQYKLKIVLKDSHRGNSLLKMPE